MALRSTQAIASEQGSKEFLTENGYSKFEIRNAVDVRMESAEGVEKPMDV